MPVKETVAQRKTRIGMLLADYDARSREYRKLGKDVAALKEQIGEIDSGAYGDWILSRGTPREIMDQRAVKDDYTRRGETMPTTITNPSIVVAPAAGK